MAGDERILDTQDFADLFPRHLEPQRNVRGIDLKQSAKPPARQLFRDQVGGSQPMRAAESLKASGLDDFTAEPDLKPDPKAEAAILGGSFRNLSGLRGYPAGRCQSGETPPDLDTVIHGLKPEV
jgi:hypothetical protein